MTARSSLASIGLLAIGTVIGFLLLESALRAAAFFEHRGVLTPRRELPPDPPQGRPARLGQMIRQTANPRIIYELRPSLQVFYDGGVVTTNARGFRGRLHPTERGEGGFRIVGLGDSMMFGQGVHDGETYLARLEDRLNAADPSRRFEVVNAAVPGYNTVMEVETLKEKGLAYQPDLVVIEFVSNDFDLPNFIRLPPDVWAWDRSFLLEFVKGRFSRARAPVPGVDAPGLRGAPTEGSGEFLGDPSRVPPEYAGMVGWSAYRSALRELAALAERHRFRVVLMGWDAVPEERKVRRLAESLGFAVLNLYPALEREARKLGFDDYRASPLMRPGDAHPAAAGHELLSRTLHAFLVERGLLLHSPLQ